MLPTFLLPLAALLTPASPASPASPDSAATVSAAHAIAGAVVFDLDRGEQWTVALDDDGAATATTIDRAARGRDARGRDARDARPNAIVLPARIERIDASADGTHVIVRGDGRAVAVALTEG